MMLYGNQVNWGWYKDIKDRDTKDGRYKPLQTHGWGNNRRVAFDHTVTGVKRISIDLNLMFIQTHKHTNTHTLWYTYTDRNSKMANNSKVV